MRLYISTIYTGAESAGPPRVFSLLVGWLVSWLLLTLFVITFVLVYVDCTQTRALGYVRLKVK
jgi:hypothetical protein